MKLKEGEKKFVSKSIFWDQNVLQGVQDQKCQKERAISLEGNTFDPTLVKPKCV